MSKSVLVIDTPKYCALCVLRSGVLHPFCRVNNRDITKLSIRPDWCPLKQLPEKSAIENGMTDYQCGMIDGEHRQAIPKTDIRNNGHNKCCNKLAVYEDLEEQGLLVRLPCKVGTEVYYILGIPNKTPCTIDKCVFKLSDVHKIGESLFLTREEAEKKLEEMKNND